MISFLRADPKTQPPKLETQRSELEVDRGSYVDSLRLVLRTLPAAVDHLSDIPVLAFLWATGYTRLFWIGLAIDLLPGMYQSIFRKICLKHLFAP